MYKEEDLLNKIKNQEEESLNLDYKAAGSLDKAPKKKEEITKDVSAMANSDGGLIIYGVSEYNEEDKCHLPEKLSPISRTDYPKEWIENIITNIRLRISGLVVHPIQLSSGENDVAYVIEIPKSTTAHQAIDKRYYKRFNFKSEPMEDYEVRMTINRSQHPSLSVQFFYENFPNAINWRTGEPKNISGQYRLTALLRHIGGPLADKIAFQIIVPRYWTDTGGFPISERRSFDYNTFNTYAHIWEPLFPGQAIEFDLVLPDTFWKLEGGAAHSNEFVEFKLWADSAIPLEGKLDASNQSKDIPFIDDIRKRPIN